MTTKTVYFHAPDWWISDNAGVGVHHWGGTRPGSAWPGERATLVEGTQAIFKFDIEESESFMFTRIPGSGDISDWGAKTKELSLVQAGGNNMYNASASAVVWGDPGVSGKWEYYQDPNIEPEDPTATYSFEASGTNLNGEELNFSYSAEGIDNLDLSAIPTGTTLTVTVTGLAEAEDGYQSLVSGVSNFDSETSTFTYKVTSNTSLIITQTQVISNGLYLFGSMMMLEEGDGGWKIEALTPEWKLQETENDAEGFSQWKINIPATLVGEQVKVVYVQNGSIGSGDYKTWNQELCGSSEGYVSFSEDGNLIVPNVSNESTMWISDHDGLWRAYFEVLDVTDTPTLILDLEEVYCDRTEEELEKGSTFTCTLRPVEGSSIDPSTLKLWYGNKEYSISSDEYGYITHDEETNEYYIQIDNVEKNIKIQADALLAAGSYLYYNLNGHRHYKKISGDPISAEEEICFDIDVLMLDGFEDSDMLDGSDIQFKILESNGESNGKTWYDPNKEYNEEYQIKASGGETVIGLVTNNAGAFGLDMGVKFDENHTKYRIYFTKYDSFGRYWITQVNHVDLEATNIQSINVFSQEQTYFEHSENNIKKDDLPVYLWENISIAIDFKPDAEVSFGITEGYSWEQDPDTLIYTIQYGADTFRDVDSYGPYGWQDFVRPDLNIKALGSIPGENCFSLYLADGTWIKDFIPHRYDTDNTTILEWKAQGTEEQPLKMDSSNQYIIVWNNEETPKEILPFDKAEVGETKASGVGVSSDVDAYLAYLRTTSEYVLWSTEEHEVTIYCTPVEDKVRLWINIEDAIKCEIATSIGVKPEGANVATTITPIKDVWYDEETLTYHSYNRHTPECKITVSGGYGISEAISSGNTATVVNHQHVDFIGSSIYYATEPQTANIVIDVFKQTDYKNIILYDGNTTDTTMLYPKTSITQVVDTIGDNLETVLNRLIERIAVLEQALNNN